jgi:hypothetical protein
MKSDDDNKLNPVKSGDFFADIIKQTGSPVTSHHPIYWCQSYLCSTSVIHQFVINHRAFDKQIGDTCRMWVHFVDIADTDYSCYYCWEGFYIRPHHLKVKVTIDGVVSGGHTTRLVLTEKCRFKDVILKGEL